MKFVMGYSASTDEAYKDSGNLVMEAVTNIRTVASFGNQKVLLNFLEDKLRLPEGKIQYKGHVSGVSFGFSQFIMFVSNAIIFYCGAILHNETGLDSLDMFTAIFALMFAAQAAGMSYFILFFYKKNRFIIPLHSKTMVLSLNLLSN